jgi:predicted SAM-dependent methyltransferase
MTDEYKYYLRPVGKGIKLHLGCGDYWFDGYLNIDHKIFGGTDMIWDIREKLPFQNDVVELIESHDVIEHFTEAEIANMLDDWYRILIKGGRVIGTLPEFDLVLQSDNPKKIEYIYGMGSEHRWGYTKDTIRELFEKHNFQNIDIISFDTGKDPCPRMKVEAYK